MLGGNKNNINEILDRYLPRSSKKEAVVARDRFLLLLKQRHELQEALDNFRTPEPVTDSKFVSLGHADQLVLTAIYLLRGEGTSLRIAEKVNDLTPKVIDTGAVFVSLDRMERGRLISSKLAQVDDDDEPQMTFSVTAEGKRMLGEVRTAAQRLAEVLSDFA